MVQALQIDAALNVVFANVPLHYFVILKLRGPKIRYYSLLSMGTCCPRDEREKKKGGRVGTRRRGLLLIRWFRVLITFFGHRVFQFCRVETLHTRHSCGIGRGGGVMCEVGFQNDIITLIVAWSALCKYDR